ncbi:MAG: 3-dehydroquinate synthase [Asticcacaulis sp.]
MSLVPVAGTDFQAYDVVIRAGILDHVADEIRPFLAHPRVTIVTDTTVAPLQGETLKARLEAAGLQVSLLTVPAGEQSKSFQQLEQLCDDLLALGLDRKELILALGGGVVGDLVGFAAAIYMRGISFIQIPTTLLAQVDSSVGGKTAIDTPRGKNMIGAFWQPRRVLCDLSTLNTLPDRHMRSGFAEVIKYGLLGDAAFFEQLVRDTPAILARDPMALEAAVTRSVAMKAEIVAEDAREAGRRALLNLGHTFGHALEAETGFGETLLHGEGVALGMAQAFRFSARLGLCSDDDAQAAESALKAAGLPTRLSDLADHTFKAETLLAHMQHDKKAEGGDLVLILADAIGQARVVRGVDPQAVLAFLKAEGATA